MQIYLDTSALCRPFDDQGQERIHMESEAVSTIVRLVREEALKLLGSQALDLEISRNPNPEDRAEVQRTLALSSGWLASSGETLARAAELQREGLKAMDALHLSLAEAGNAAAFITCDDRIARRYRGRVRVLNPLEFVLRLTEYKV